MVMTPESEFFRFFRDSGGRLQPLTGAPAAAPATPGNSSASPAAPATPAPGAPATPQ
jgi:membrane protease subunit HflC